MGDAIKQFKNCRKLMNVIRCKKRTKFYNFWNVSKKNEWIPKQWIIRFKWNTIQLNDANMRKNSLIFAFVMWRTCKIIWHVYNKSTCVFSVQRVSCESDDIYWWILKFRHVTAWFKYELKTLNTMYTKWSKRKSLHLFDSGATVDKPFNLF